MPPVIANLNAAEVYESIYGVGPKGPMTYSYCPDIVGPVSVLETVSYIVLGRMIEWGAHAQPEDLARLRGAYDAISLANEHLLVKTLRSHRVLVNDLEALFANKRTRIYRPLQPLVKDPAVVFLERSGVAFALRFGYQGDVKAYLSFAVSKAATAINPYRRRLMLGAYLMQRNDRRYGLSV